MAWDPRFVIHHDWPHRIGYHMNVTRSAIPADSPAWKASGVPHSPDNVWAGDPGVPREIHVKQAKGGSYEIAANPDWTPGSPQYDTVFCIFIDEADARECLPHLWLDAA